MIYAGFMACHELHLLEIYFRETESVVDRWVVCEADKSFTFNAKPLFVWENRARYAKWWDRVIHVRVTGVPAQMKQHERDQWNRDCIARGFGGVKREDIVILGDLDEIPRASTVASYRIEQGPCSLRMDQYYWFMGIKAPDSPWDRCKIMPGYYAMDHTPHDIRHPVHPIIENGGWHFSSFGGADAQAYKLANFAHAGMRHHADEVAGLRDGTWVKREHPTRIAIGGIDDTHPQFVRDNPSLMREWNMIYQPVAKEEEVSVK